MEQAVNGNGSTSLEIAGEHSINYRWLLGAAIIVFLILQIPLHDYLVDDAFIHLTFARNLANGNGFSFNPDEPTNGVTAPLWTLTLALLSTIFGSNPILAKALSILFGLLTIPAIYSIGRNLGLKSPAAEVMAFIWSVNVWLVRWSASGMESTLAVLLIVLSINAHFKGRYTAGIWYGLAVLCRPEIAVLIVILLLDYSRTYSGKHAIKALLLLVVVILPWLVYAQVTFHTIIPNPALVKSDAGLPALADFLFGLKRTILIIGGSCILELIIISFGIWAAFKGWMTTSPSAVRKVSLLFVWAVFPIIVYLSRGVFISSRYLIIGIPAIIIAAFLILDALQDYSLKIAWERLWSVIIFFMVGLHLIFTIQITLPHIEAFKPTIDALKKIAEKLRSDTAEDAVVAVGDVGVIGYYSQRKVLDFEGLVSKEIIPYRVGRRLDSLIISEDYFEVTVPDYVIDKSLIPERLTMLLGNKYEALLVEPVPGGLVSTADERWYYTLYKRCKTTKEN